MSLMETWQRVLVAGLGTAAVATASLWIYSKVVQLDIPRAVYPVYVIPASVAAAAVAAVR
jgi:hypothetical protein